MAHFGEKFEPRGYQVELFDAALKENIIACLGTGTGKTFIGIMLIRELSYQIRKPLGEGGKITIFLVPTVPLVAQQRKVIETHTDLIVDGFYGDRGVDLWSGEEWMDHFHKNQVLVMVAEVFRNVLNHGFISLNKINLIIFDECHRAVKSHPYSEIMRMFTNYSPPYPRVMGLTASVLNGKCRASKLEKHLLDLERTLKSKAIVASDIIGMEKYGTKPSEMLYYYTMPVEDLENRALKEISNLLQMAQKQIDKAKEVGSNFKLECDPDNTDMFHPYRDCKQFVIEILDIVKTMGLWCAYQLVVRYLNELEKTLTRLDDVTTINMCENLKSILSTVQNRIRLIMMNKSPQTLVLNEVSNKLSRLASLLLAHKPRIGKENLCGIIFVQKRVTAYILNIWINQVAKYQPYQFLKTDFVVGHGMSLTEGKQTFTSDKQHEVLQKFRLKDINLLVASSVIEEGMDIPQCNLVIRYDPPSDYRSFVQSKGRARAKPSIFAIMLPSTKGEEKNFLEDLVNYKTIENILLKICKDREVPDEEDSTKHLKDGIKEEPYKPFDREDAPMITLTSAISVVHRYCSYLPHDCFTRSKPRIDIQEFPVEGTSNIAFVCKMKMPLSSIMKEWVQGKKMETKTLAKMSAALEVCRHLHKAGELDDDHLLPKKHRLLPEEEPEDEVDFVTNSDIIKNCYPKKIAPVISGIPPQAGSQCFLYMINMTLKELKPGSEDAPSFLHLDPHSSSRCYAIVTSKPLPPLCKFTVFNMAGKLEVELIPYSEKTILLTSHKRRILGDFQKVTFTELLKLEEELLIFDLERTGYALLIGAVVRDSKSFTLDWDFMSLINERFANNQKQALRENIRKTDFVNVISNKENIAQLYEDAVVFPAHTTFNKHPLYVFQIRPDKNVKCEFVNQKYNNYESYFAQEYLVPNLNPNHPMLECFYCDKPWLAVPQYLNRMGVVTSTRNKYDRKFLLPLEVCEIQATPASMRKLAVCLPIVFHRINSLLLIHDLKKKVSEQTGIGSKIHAGLNQPIDFNWTLYDEHLIKKQNKKIAEHYAYGEVIEPDLVEDIPLEEPEEEAESDSENVPEDEEILDFNLKKRKSLDSKISSLNLDDEFEPEFSKPPSLGLLLQAVTALNATDFINLERLETVGDAFLKYATSMYAFHANPYFDEGYLTALKMREISNSKLCKIGIKLKLYEILTYSKFEPSSTFLPPGFHVIHGLEEEYAKFKNNVRNLFLCGEVEELKKLSPSEIGEKLKSDYEKQKTGSIDKKVNFSLRTLQHLSDKKIADLVEALIGAYVLSTGIKGTLLLMSWLGLKVLPQREDAERERLLSRNTPVILATFTDIPLPPTALLKETEWHFERLDQLLSGFEVLEDKIGYKFKDKSYLLQAFTHTSYNGMHVTDCYQRLEFLGDAVLDYVITRHLYEDKMNFSPGELSDLRQALVNNSFFAVLAVKYDLHKYLKYAAPGLLHAVDKFASKVKSSKSEDLLEDLGCVLREDECEFAEEIEVPKALGDVIESLAGAMYLDSGYSFDVVWKIFKNMMANELEFFRKSIPINPIRHLMEMYPKKGKLKFGEPLPLKTRTAIKVTIETKDGEFQTFGGVGVNKKMAKVTAAKKALKELGKIRRNHRY